MTNRVHVQVFDEQFLMSTVFDEQFLMNTVFNEQFLMNMVFDERFSMNMILDEPFSMNMFFDERISVLRRPTKIIHCRACQAALHAGQPLFLFQSKYPLFNVFIIT
jgi:hypothetical protein